MKKRLLLVCLMALILVGCQKEKPASTIIEGTKITELRSYTEKSPNPIDVSNLKLDKSKETLESLTHVSKNRLFYMDYLADFPMEKLCKTGEDRYTYKSDLSGETEYLSDFVELLYKNPPVPHPMDDPLTHCSAFVSHNEKKELLFCQNLDGEGGSIIAVYQRPRNGLHGFVALSNTVYNTIRFAPEYIEEGRLMDGKSDLSILLTQHMSNLGGMNDQGLCYCVLQLPPLKKLEDYDPKGTMPHVTLENKKGDNSLPQLTNSSMYYMLLTRCATVKDVEKALREDYDYTQLNHIMNSHIFVTDATGDYAIFEYWNDKLYVLRAEDHRLALNNTSHVIPFEYNSIENYYCNPEATATYMQDLWQYGFSPKQRVGRMMTYYEPVMSEFEALKCLQKGTYGVEYPDELTNFSAVYNPVERTVLFNVYNDMSEAFTIDLKKDLR